MRRPGLIVAALGFFLVVAACAKPDPSRQVMNKEDALTASGFTFVPANTPQRQAAFSKLPPHKFIQQVRDGKVIYVYPDPTICVCIYVGGPRAYAAYRARVFDKQLANEQTTTADPGYLSSWDWSTWGDGYPMGWPYTELVN